MDQRFSGKPCSNSRSSQIEDTEFISELCPLHPQMSLGVRIFKTMDGTNGTNQRNNGQTRRGGEIRMLTLISGTSGNWTLSQATIKDLSVNELLRRRVHGWSFEIKTPTRNKRICGRSCERNTISPNSARISRSCERCVVYFKKDSKIKIENCHGNKWKSAGLAERQPQ